MVRAVVAVGLALTACGGVEAGLGQPGGDRPATSATSSASSPPATSSNPTPSASVAPSASAATTSEAVAPPRFVRLTVGGPEPRLVAAQLREALPALGRCAAAREPTAPLQPEVGFLDLELTVGKDGTPKDVRASGELAGAARCAEDTVRALRFVPRPSEARVRATLGVALPNAEGRYAPTEGLLTLPGGRCEAVERVDCPANKMCEAPRKRSIACPDEVGLPARPDLDSAERRVEIALGGGKPGWAAERIVLGRQGGACAGLIEQRSDAIDLLDETFDVPCAAFEQVAAKAAAAFPGAAPPTKPTADGADHYLAFWTLAPGQDAARVREVRWSGPSPRDEAFGELGSAFARAIARWHVVGLVRFSP